MTRNSPEEIRKLAAISQAILSRGWYELEWGRAKPPLGETAAGSIKLLCRISNGHEIISAEGYTKYDALANAYQRAGLGTFIIPRASRG